MRACVCVSEKSGEGVLGRERGVRLSESDALAAAALLLSQPRAWSCVDTEKKGIVNAKSCYNTDINMCRTARLHTHAHTLATNKTHTLILLSSAAL